MTVEELEFKEKTLRHDFMEKLECLNVSGHNDIHAIKCIKTYGALWHYVHQLLLAEQEHAVQEHGQMQHMHAENVHADSVTSLKVAGAHK